MSRENGKIARQAIDAFEHRHVEALRALSDPDVELDWSASLGPDAPAEITAGLPRTPGW
jgi:hypothetical protein